jgi:hypothetical protein
MSTRFSVCEYMSCMYVCMYVCHVEQVQSLLQRMDDMSTRFSVCVCVCVHVRCLYIYIYIYIYIYTYIMYVCVCCKFVCVKKIG